MTVVIRGMRELSAAYAAMERDVRRELPAALRDASEPVRREAEGLAVSRIRRMPNSPRWSRMRTGVTRTLVYVAPRQRGVKSRHADDPRRRPNLGDLLMDRAMEPALEHNATEVERTIEQTLDRLAGKFNNGGAIL